MNHNEPSKAQAALAARWKLAAARQAMREAEQRLSEADHAFVVAREAYYALLDAQKGGE